MRAAVDENQLITPVESGFQSLLQYVHTYLVPGYTELAWGKVVTGLSSDWIAESPPRQQTLVKLCEGEEYLGII